MASLNKKQIGEIATKVAYHKPHEAWKMTKNSLVREEDMAYFSKIDDSFISHDTKLLKELFEMGVTEDIQANKKGGNVACIGFNPSNQKWYGWSHRACTGFGIGHVMKKTSVLYSSGWTEGSKQDKEYIKTISKFPVGYKVKTLHECKQLACLFAESVG